MGQLERNDYGSHFLKFAYFKFQTKPRLTDKNSYMF